MKKYIALKPCNFGGQRFIVNDEVPEELIAPERVKSLVKYGVIAALDIQDATPPVEQTGEPAADSADDAAKPDEEPKAEDTADDKPADEEPKVEEQTAAPKKAAKGGKK